MEPVGQNLSMLTLILQADPAVKAVMVMLAIASLWSWSIAIDKWLLFADIETRTKEFEKKFWSGRGVDDIDDRASEKAGGAMARVFAVGAREWREAERSMTNMSQVQLAQDRVDRLMSAAAQRELARAGKGLGALATIGSAAPFIGLFGTVWGIMNSFTAIAANQQTNLAVVAPGIAEALFATALGLFAAIPAVVFYNKFAGDLDRLADTLESFSDEVAARFSRRVGERG
ncbi:MAG: protein TolQ [Hyphomonadaceae bacterium]|nr:protein TolQ [Hyphomonadaceae bacterium]